MAITTFTASQVLTAAQMNAVQGNDYNQTVSTKTASTTLVAADKGTRVVMNVASANTITVDTSLFSAGDTVVLQNIGAGVSTVTAGTATVSSAGPLAIPQYGSGTLYFTSAGVSIYFPSAVTAAAGALTRITGGSLSSTSTAVTSAFSADYKNYVVYFNSFVVAAAEYCQIQISSSSVHSYNLTNQTGTSGGAPAGFNSAANASAMDIVYSTSGNTMSGYIQIESPFLTTSTSVNSFMAPGSSVGNSFMSMQGVVKDTTSYTGFTILSGSTSMSGNFSVYGYALS